MLLLLLVFELENDWLEISCSVVLGFLIIFILNSIDANFKFTRGRLLIFYPLVVCL